MTKLDYDKVQAAIRAVQLDCEIPFDLGQEETNLTLTTNQMAFIRLLTGGDDEATTDLLQHLLTEAVHALVSDLDRNRRHGLYADD